MELTLNAKKIRIVENHETMYLKKCADKVHFQFPTQKVFSLF